MTVTRSAYRAAAGKRCGRGLYVSSTTTGTSTVNEIVDTTRTEFPAAFDGSTIYFSGVTAPKVALVRGSDPVGRIFLDTDLGSVPASLSAYELFKGLTLADYDDAIDWAFADAFPHFYLPINDRTVTETAGTSTITLAESWREISQVRRQIVGSTAPVQYEVLTEGTDYLLRQGATGLEYEATYTTVTATKLHFAGRGIATLGSTDASTGIAPLQLIVPGALAYLYGKGSNADELSMGQKFDAKHKEAMALFEQAKIRYRLRPQTITARLPRVFITNDGSAITDA